MDALKVLLQWLENPQTGRSTSLHLPPCHPTKSTSLHDLIMQPDFQRQPLVPLFSSSGAFIDRLGVIALPPSASLTAARTSWSLHQPPRQASTKKHDMEDHASEQKKKQQRSDDHVTIQHY